MLSGAHRKEPLTIAAALATVTLTEKVWSASPAHVEPRVQALVLHARSELN